MTLAQYKDHPIRPQLQQLLDYQSRPEFAEPVIAGNEQYSFARDKVFSIGKLLTAHLESTPATLASVGALSNMHSHLQAPINELNAFIGNRNPGHIVNAASQLEQNVLPLLWGLPVISSDAKSRTLSKLLDGHAATAQAAIEQLNAERTALQKELAALQTAAELARQEIAAISKAAAKERAEASAAVASLQKEFAEAELGRLSSFAKEVDGFKDEFKAELLTAKQSAGEALVDLDRQRERAAKIVQVVGNIGVTGNFQRIADEEAKQANRWRWITIGIFATGIGVALLTFGKFWNLPFTAENLGSVVVRLLYAIAITAPAWYTARESARHRTTADRARQTELELASLGPFIELMPEEKKNDIKEALTKVYFGGQQEPHTVKSPIEVAGIEKMTELIKVVRG